MARNKNIVTVIENDGDFIEAQFVRENGEVVIGIYKRFGWVKAPQKIVDEVKAALQHPAENVILTGRPSGQVRR